jgi:hypothetical protein
MAKKTPIAELPRITGIGKPSKLPKPKRFPIKPTGWEHLKLGVRPLRIGIGPGEPPPGFVGAHTSRTEWLVYWALFRKLAPDANPRQPPFTGIPGVFVYQKIDDGGRVPGGSVTDMQVATPTGWIGLRIDTERWHIFAGPNQQAKDLFIKTHLRAVQRVVTLYEQDFIADDTGEAVCKVVALALRGIELMNPIRSGLAQRRRPYIPRRQVT